MDYETIKELADSMGAKVPDLLAMAPKNDPFYSGTPRDWEMARWFKTQVWDRAGYRSGVHLRRAHYWCVSRETRLPRPIKQGKIQSDIYLNSIGAWGYLCQAAKMARYLGLVQISAIVDNKNPNPTINFKPHFGGESGFDIEIPELKDPYIWLNLPEYADVAPYLCEVWVEKSTMDDVLGPVCSQYNANLVTFQGEASITACYELMRRIEGRDDLVGVRIFYISDFDPAGMSMSKAVARKVEWMLGQFELDTNVRLKSLALTPDQVARYRLPRTPIKDDESRAGKFEEAFGEGAVELDALEALHPGVLGKLLRDSLSEYWDADIAAEIGERENAARERIGDLVQEVTDRYADQIQALAAMQRELGEIDTDLGDLVTDPSTLDVDEDEADWMFDSGRQYLAQIPFYKEHVGRESIF